MQNQIYYLSNSEIIELVKANPDDLEIVLSCVEQYPQSLEYAGEKARADMNIVVAATKRHSDLWDFVDPILKRDKQFILTVMEYDDIAWRFAKLYDVIDQEIILEAIFHKPALCIEVKYTDDVRFIHANHIFLDKHDWPIIKKALLENLSDFLNPPESIRSLTYKRNYRLFAEYALSMRMSMENIDLPAF